MKKERRFSLEGHKLYYVLCAYWLFYVTCQNDDAFIFLWQWKLTTRIETMKVFP